MSLSSSKHRPANVLIVEDDSEFAHKMIASHFEDDWRVEITCNVPQSLRAIRKIVDLRLAVVDLDIPGGSQDTQTSLGAGFEVIEVLQERFSQARIVVLTGHHIPQLINKAQRMHVEFMSKTGCALNLGILAGELLRAELGHGDEPPIAATRCLVEESSLTTKQSEVLMLLVRNYSREEIMREMDITSWTLKSHTHEIVKRTGSKIADLLRGLRRRGADS